MISETTIQSQQNSYWVVFNEHTGLVKRVSGTKPSNVNPGDNAVLSDNQDIEKLLTGKLKSKNFYVDKCLITDDWIVIKKTNKLNLSPTSKKLENIKIGKQQEECDVNIEINKNTHMFTVSLNKQKIIKDNKLTFINEVSKNEHSILNFFICKKNDKDFLLASIQINMDNLIKENISTKLPNDIDVDNINIFTLPVFEKYQVEIQSEHNTSNDQETGQINIYKVNDNTLELYNNLSNKQKRKLSRKKYLKVIICDKEIDNLIGGTVLHVDDILQNSKCNITLDFKLPTTPFFVSKNVSMKYNGEQHEQDD